MGLPVSSVIFQFLLSCSLETKASLGSGLIDEPRTSALYYGAQGRKELIVTILVSMTLRMKQITFRNTVFVII